MNQKGKNMSNEKRLDTRQVSLRIRIETVIKTVQQFGREEDDGATAPALIRAIEEATRDVELPPEAYEEIAAEIRRNKEERKIKRARLSK